MANVDTLRPASDEELSAQEAGFAAIERLIDGARSVVVCGHMSPDGDALGSALALAELIERRWPDVTCTRLLAENEEVPRIYRFLPGAERLVQPRDFNECPDVFFAVDLSASGRLADAERVLERSRAAAILDHHPCEDPFAEASVVRPSAAAAGVIVCEFSLWLGIEVSETMAQNLFCALMTDTGRFQYQNADAEAFACASLLVCAGADPAAISLNVYQSFRLQFLHLKSAVMGRVKTFESGRIAYSYATAADLARTGADLTEADGLVDVVRSVEGAEVALFLKTIPGGKVRGNLRSKGDHDVSSVARLVGGGGHRAAAGFTVTGDIDEALSLVLPALRRLVRGESGDGQ